MIADNSTSPISTRHDFPLSRLCSNDYFEARSNFLKAAKENSEITALHSLKIKAKGDCGENLYVDIAWMGPQDAKNILVHISGTHGVEGLAGSAIQRSLLENPIQLPEDTAIIFIHGLNPFGMAHNRRVTENNVDLNRNISDERATCPLYERINDLMNPKSHRWVDFFHFRLLWKIFWFGWSNIKRTLVSGQYDFEEGLFFGGKKIEEAPHLVLEWFEDRFCQRQSSDIFVSIIDVHTGLGPYAQDTLLTPGLPSEKMLSTFGDRIKKSAQQQTTGYKPTGTFITGLKGVICRVTQCAKERIIMIAQEFGTVSVYSVMMALRNENTQHHVAKRNHESLSPGSPERQELLRVFYPSDHKWRHLVVNRGRELVDQVIQFFDNAH